ncbi:Hypothetical protein D9617_9g024790 [Elsinoe fawcettii]|nr:Hypothetical protein D9617_9g024790 [Elsinoe fawcettii]
MSGIVTNPGWKLDKWKFMPMINQTFHEHPDMKWYVFIEADTSMLWSMMLQYLALFDHTKPYYIGSATQIGKGLFAHGGSGFVISHPAMRSVTHHYTAHKAEIEALTDKEWAGDLILGKSLEAVGIRPTDAWPHFQGDYPGLVPYDNSDNGRYGFGTTPRIWCRPTISYHHMSSDMIRSLWEFEQRWLMTHNSSDTLTHGDVFREYVMPQMMTGKAKWDNLSDKEEPDLSNVAACQASNVKLAHILDWEDQATAQIQDGSRTA